MANIQQAFSSYCWSRRAALQDMTTIALSDGSTAYRIEAPNLSLSETQALE
jgi:hypothetical protein